MEAPRRFGKMVKALISLMKLFKQTTLLLASLGLLPLYLVVQLKRITHPRGGFFFVTASLLYKENEKSAWNIFN